MFKKLAFLAVLVLLVAAAYGAATTIGLTGGAIQYGVDADLSCDSSIQVLGWGLETDTDLVSNVRIGDIAEACQGNALFVQVLNGPTSVIARGNVDPLTTTEVTVPFNVAVHTADITTLKVWIEGPNP